LEGAHVCQHAPSRRHGAPWVEITMKEKFPHPDQD